MDNLIFIELPPGIKEYAIDAMSVSIDQFINDCIRFYRSCEWNNRECMHSAIFNAYFGAHILLVSEMEYAQGKEVTNDFLQHIIERRLAAGKKTILTANCPRESLCGLNPALYDLLMTANVKNISLHEPDFFHQSS